MLFCILENSIRRLIVSIANNPDDDSQSLMPFTRILAEDDILFVSFLHLNHRDLFRMKIPFSLSHSQLTRWLSPGFMSLLQDLIISNQGPRLRDHLAHFQVDSKGVPPVMVDMVLNLCIYGILRFSWCDLVDNEIVTRSLGEIYQFVHRYTPCYHPLSFCVSEWKRFKSECAEFRGYATMHCSMEVMSVQCGQKMVNVLSTLNITASLVDTMRSIRAKARNMECTPKQLCFRTTFIQMEFRNGRFYQKYRAKVDQITFNRSSAHKDLLNAFLPIHSGYTARYRTIPNPI